MLIYYLLLGLIIFCLGIYGLISIRNPWYRPQFILLMQSAALFIVLALGHFLSLSNYQVFFFFLALIFVSQFLLLTLLTFWRQKNIQEGEEDRGTLKW